MASGDTAGGRRRNARGQGQILRTQLVEAAARLLATLEQPESITLRQVAREVGVAPASIYSHFPDLGTLLDHVLELRYTEIVRLLSAADTAPTPLAKLVRRCAAYIQWGIEHPGEYRTLFGGRMPASVISSSHRAGLELLDAMSAALAAVNDPEHESSTDLRWRGGLLLWTSMHGLIDSYTEHKNVPWPPMDELVVGIVALHTGRPEPELADLLREMQTEHH